MAAPEGRAGLGLRQKSAVRLAEVLAGSDFHPFDATDIADSRDRAQANRLVTTALRRQGHLNVIVGRLLERGPPKRAGSFEAHLRLALAQLLYLPEMGDHSAVHLAVEAIKRDSRARRFVPLMNAALRRAQADADILRALPGKLLLPHPLQQGWAQRYGQEAIDNAVDNLLAGAPLDLTLKADDPSLVATLGARPLFADTVRIDERDRTVAELPGYTDGHWWVQDMAAAIPARLLRLAHGARVLDMCAAPGGKTAQLLKSGYRVSALDNSAPRLERLRANLDRLGYAAEVILDDAGTFRPAESFDGVLLDAPCSATGTFRRHPEVIWRRGAGRIRDRVELQRQLITNALACLNPGGVLIYCVCSLEPDEGEAQVEWIAGNKPDLIPDPVAPKELAGLTGALTGAGTVRTHPGLRVPGDKPGTLDGFFVARFRRR